MSKCKLRFAATLLAISFIFVVKDDTPCSMKSDQCYPSARQRQPITDLILKMLARDIIRVEREGDCGFRTIGVRASDFCALIRGVVVILHSTLLLIEF
jgi:hypothetical protein